MQQILVTGGAGRLGRLVVKHLSQAGHRVHGMSRRASPGEDWPGAEWQQTDLVTGAGLPRAVQGMDVVVHTAGKGTWQVDFEGTRRLLDAAREAGVSHVVVQAGPSGRLPDIGGPQVYTSGELARIWLKQHGMHRAIIPLWLPGKTASGLRQGGNTCPQQATGTISWEAWLQHH